MNANERQVGGAHYQPGVSYSHWDWCVENNMAYLEGQITRYIARHKTSGKGPEDREKALHYAEKLLEVTLHKTSVQGIWVFPGQCRFNALTSLEKMTKLYALTEKETEILRLVVEYDCIEDLRALRELCRQLVDEGPKTPLYWRIRSGRKLYVFGTEPKIEPMYEYSGLPAGEVVFDELSRITSVVLPTKPGKYPIDRPCSACSAGDHEMKHHDHDPPFRAGYGPGLKERGE